MCKLRGSSIFENYLIVQIKRIFQDFSLKIILSIEIQDMRKIILIQHRLKRHEFKGDLALWLTGLVLKSNSWTNVCHGDIIYIYIITVFKYIYIYSLVSYVSFLLKTFNNNFP